MSNAKVVEITSNAIIFDNGYSLYSDHKRECCEHHYLDLDDLALDDFDGLEFDLSDDDFFERIEGYGIALKPINGHPVRIAGHGDNNGYYSCNLSLVLSFKGEKKVYDITNCQDY